MFSGHFRFNSHLLGRRRRARDALKLKVFYPNPFQFPPPYSERRFPVVGGARTDSLRSPPAKPFLFQFPPPYSGWTIDTVGRNWIRTSNREFRRIPCVHTYAASHSEPAWIRTKIPRFRRVALPRTDYPWFLFIYAYRFIWSWCWSRTSKRR